MVCTYHINSAEEPRIGRVTFSMSFNVTYTIIKPHIKELAHNVAEELELQASQVKSFVIGMHYL